MNKRISKKLAKMTPVRDFTLQEAWDKVAQHIATEAPMFAACYFIDERDNKLQIYNAGNAFQPIVTSTKTYDELKQMKKEVYLEPEEVTFYCKECGDEMDAQTDIANEGLCGPCNKGQKEMWAAEQKHEAYEYRNMKL